MRNLVTGGAGFMGSHLIESLIKAGEEDFCIDNLSTGDEKNVLRWKTSNKFKFLFQYVIDPIKIEADRIWHLACPASTFNY